MLSNKQKLMLMFCFTGFLFLGVGCEQEGPAEQAGENVDKSMQKTGENIEETGEKIQDSAK
jgi:hypothetical protein